VRRNAVPAPGARPDGARAVRRTLAALALLLVGLALVAALRWWLGRDEDLLSAAASDLAKEGAAPRPLGVAAYRALLAREAGADIDPGALVERAAAVGGALEAMLDERAAVLDPGAGDWRPVFARLSEDHPDGVEGVLELYRQETRRAESFCRKLMLVPLPARPPRVIAVENPALRQLFPIGLYLGEGTFAVTVEPPLGDGASYRRNHCRICVPAIAVHEGYPGHHVAFARLAPGRKPTREERLPFYQEGWAQYGEVLFWERGYWQGQAALELGALRLMRLRALRAEVDAALHSGRMTSEEAARAYRERAAVDATAAAGEVAGHLHGPARKASYLVGALQLLALRAAAGDPHGEDLRAFHERFLTRVAPIPEVARELFGLEIPGLPERDLLPARGPRP
jgi:uncharacterized protein (DUF885 family)